MSDDDTRLELQVSLMSDQVDVNEKLHKYIYIYIFEAIVIAVLSTIQSFCYFCVDEFLLLSCNLVS